MNPDSDFAPRDPEMVRDMFGRIAPRYDLANHLLSCCADFSWRARAARLVQSWRPERILDLAAGSGDLALAIKRRLPDARIVAADFSPEMLAVARAKGVEETIVADALQLPFPDRSFDCATIAFGLRNIADWAAALREMARVLATNGHLLILDFSIPKSFLRVPYRLYLHHCLPRVAAMVTGQKDAYRYLGTSIEAFPSGKDMLRLIEANGFTNAQTQLMTAGIAVIYHAVKK